MRSAVLPRRPGAPGWIRTSDVGLKRTPLWPLSYESADRAAGFEPARDYSIAVNLGVEPSFHRPERCVLPIDQSTIAREVGGSYVDTSTLPHDLAATCTEFESVTPCVTSKCANRCANRPWLAREGSNLCRMSNNHSRYRYATRDHFLICPTLPLCYSPTVDPTGLEPAASTVQKSRSPR